MALSTVDVALALARCAQERIHLPGAIQPHGCLIAFSPTSLRVTQASANVQAFVGVDPEGLLGRPVTSWMSIEDARRFERALLDALGDEADALTFSSGHRRLVGTVHAGDDVVLLELEASGPDTERAGQAGTAGALKRLASAGDLPALARTTTDVVRRLVGFDRVVVYRFAEDGSGEVIAESCADKLQPYAGLRFPESDIPRQARELYLRSWIRAIPDARYVPSALVPELRPDSGAPLDLSAAALRSISPMHLTYLAAMGVRASLSASLIVNGKLWGLISCGNRAPAALPPGIRSTCETIARLVSSQIAALEARELKHRKAADAPAIRALEQAMRESPLTALDGLLARPECLLEVMRATGAAVVVDGRATTVGSCPPADDIADLAAWVSPHVDDRGIWSTPQLGLANPHWHAHADNASSLLAFALPPPLQACLLWFRPELVHSVQWGGKPPLASTPDEPALLGPARSFSAWQETVRGKGEPWDEADKEAAAEMRQIAIEVDLGNQVRQHKAAVQARDDLVAVVSHDLRTPMSIVAMQAAIIHRTVAADPTDTSHRLRASALTIQRAADRMNSLLRDLLDLARIEAGRFEIEASVQSARHIVDDACGLLLSIADAKGVELVPGDSTDAQVRVDPERIFQVFANLIGNAVKFSAPGTQVSVGGVARDGDYQFHVMDRGIGISGDQQSRVFERYWQAKQSASDGAGLGLYISKGIVEAHGGTLRLESELGLGTTFMFTVPLA